MTLKFNNRLSITPVEEGSGQPAVIESLSVTPTTEEQTITVPEGVDGYSPITVSAVNHSIDPNIISANIKDGIDILGVGGTYKGGEYNNSVLLHGYPNYNGMTGEATNFSSVNYLSAANIDLTTADSWEMVASICITTKNRYQFWYQQPVTIGFDNTNHLHIWGLPDGDVYNAYSSIWELNTVYWIKVEFTGTEYNAYYKKFKEAEWERIIHVVSSNKVNVTTYPVIMGINPNNTSEYFYGTIYLSECYIKINNVVVWSGDGELQPWYTVGSPTISDGKISGFSNSNYIVANYIYSVKSSDSPEVQVHFKTPATNFTNYENLIMLTSAWYMGINIAVRPNNEGFMYMYNSEHTFVDASLQTDTEYWVKFAFPSAGKVQLYYSTDGINFTALGNPSATQKNHKSDREVQIGKREGNPAADFEGQIFTEGTFIKINNETVWSM